MSIPSGDVSTADASSDTDHCDIVCFSHLRWHFVTQRPQHLLTLAAQDHRVFYWEEPVWHQPGELAPQSDGQFGSHLEVIEEATNLWVLRPHLTWGIDFEAGQRELLDGLTRSFALNNLIVWFYTPMAINIAIRLQPLAVVYDCMDELSAFLNPPAGLLENERSLLQQADVVFTGGISLYEAKSTRHANVHAFPSSIDAAHFACAATGTLPDPADQAAIPHPRAGFYGVVDERFDVALLTQIAALRPAVHFIILGPVVKIDPATLPHADNIHYLPGKSYDELPAYLSGWDVAIMPFALNDATRFISPTKTPEFLAAGRPIVSTPIRDVVRGYGEANLVAIAASAEDFASAIDASLQPQSENWRAAVQAKLAQSSWQGTWRSMWHQIERVLPDPGVRSGGGSPFTVSRRDVASFTRHSVPRHKESFDFIVVGAGFAGSVLAERLANTHRRVLVIDKRDHIAGNAFDYINSDGIMVHRYGPHIFHTNSIEVVAYLSRFTDWRPYEHRVLSSVEGKLYPMPINLDTINQMYGLSLDADGMRAFLAARTITPASIRTSEDIVVSRVGRELYERFFRNYTRKQWGLDPSQLDASVAGRIPVRFDRDDRYFTDSFQAMPLHGYTAMFERMLDHSNITTRTGVDYRVIQRTYPAAQVIYTGPIDEYFGFRFGHLPYLSLDFRHETHDCEVFQPAPVVNHPNEHDYTRVTEFKYLTGQQHPRTSIVYEYPRSTGDPYYPIPRPENAALFARYRTLADASANVHFCGRLGSYRYLNMDQVVAQALATFKRSFAREVRSLEVQPIPLSLPWVPLPAD